MIELIGWIACILLSCCGLPQVIKTWITQKAGDISWWFLLIWFTGDLLMGFYVLYDFKWPLFINYLMNGVFVGYLLYAKWRY